MIPETARRPDWPRLVKRALETLSRDKWGRTEFASLGNYADDAAAAAGGVAVGQLYRNGSVVMVRVA